jgi:hypothetical protein
VLPAAGDAMAGPLETDEPLETFSGLTVTVFSV